MVALQTYKKAAGKSPTVAPDLTWFLDMWLRQCLSPSVAW